MVQGIRLCDLIYFTTAEANASLCFRIPCAPFESMCFVTERRRAHIAVASFYRLKPDVGKNTLCSQKDYARLQ